VTQQQSNTKIWPAVAAMGASVMGGGGAAAAGGGLFSGAAAAAGGIGAGAISGAGGAGGSGLLGGLGGMDFLGAGMQLLGGVMNQRNDRKQNRYARQLQREQMMAVRAAQRETLRAGMQGQQDDYEREIMRNRSAIAPYGEMYSGPRFRTANPNAAPYNPLMNEGHMFGRLGEPLDTSNQNASFQGWQGGGIA
jgi:hypothetical protein